MATLTAYYPPSQGQTKQQCSIGWEISEYTSEYYIAIKTCVYTVNGSKIGASKGSVTFTPSTEATGTRHYWETLESSSLNPWYIGRDKYLGLASGDGMFMYLERLSSSYTATITVTFDVRSRNGLRYEDDSLATDTATYTVTVPALPRYTISYNANGGSGAPSSQTAQTGSDITLSYTTPTRSGYAFNSWNTRADGSGTSYAPGSTYSVEYNVTLYAIWNPTISYNANGGSGAPAQGTKTYNTAYTISSAVPTKTGYVFVEWNTSNGGTGTTYSPGDTIPASMNTALTLYAMWDKITAPPTISTLTVVRCNSSGTASDTGEYAKVTAVWSVDRTYDSSNTGSITGRYAVSGSSFTSFSLTGDASGTGGTATAIVSGVDTDIQYEFSVTVTDTNTDSGHTRTTTRTAILTRAVFTMDFKAGGGGVGIGAAAPSSGFECGFDAQFDRDVDVLGNLTAANLEMSSDADTDVASASGTFSTYGAVGKRFGPMRTCLARFVAGEALSAGTTYQLGTVTSAYCPSNYEMGFANDHGCGSVDVYGSVWFTPVKGVSSGAYLYVSYTIVKP